MFREIRRKDREISIIEAQQILEKAEYGVLSTYNGEFPYGVPVNYVFYDNSIYIHCAKEGHKIDNILENPKVSFCVVGSAEVLPEKFSTKYESVIVFGIAKLVEGDEKRNALLKLIKKYSPNYINQGIEYINNAFDEVNIIKIEILRLSGKARR